MSPQQTPVELAVPWLRLSPLFNLSLASKELFHSNFLAWLCERYPNEVGGIFAKFLKSPPESCSGLTVRREKKNIDLSLQYPGGELLLVENKVKSIPSRGQLEEYSASVRDPAKTSFLLLSLVHPPFLPPEQRIIRLTNGVDWHYLTYCELGAKLKVVLPQIEAVDPYHGMLGTGLQRLRPASAPPSVLPRHRLERRR